MPRNISREIGKYLIIVSFVILINGCTKKDDAISTASEQLSDDEVATVVAGSVGDENSTSGLTASINTASTWMKNAHALSPESAYNEYGLMKDTTIHRSYTGTEISYDYTLYYSYSFPTIYSLNFTLATKGYYESSVIKNTDTSNTSLTVTNPGILKTYYVLNGTSKRMGTVEAKAGVKRTVTSNVSISYDSIKVDKDSTYIFEGQASIAVTIKAASGVTKSYTAGLVFLSSKEAVLTFNGKSYTVDIVKATAIIRK